MPLKQILKTLYAPHKVFKEIIQKPKYLGPLLIIVVFLVANLGFYYSFVSKFTLEQTSPDGQKADEWTESKTFWNSTAAISESSDHINGSYYGNVSVAFAVSNENIISANLEKIGLIDCTNPNGFSLVSFRTKWTNPESRPANMSIKLLSNSSSNYFIYKTSLDPFNVTYNIWNNLTIPVNTSDWTSYGPDADLSKITGLNFDFTWNENSNITLLLDGLFFHGPAKSILAAAGGISSFVFNAGVNGFMQFGATWIILSGLVYLITKLLGGKLSWKPLFILIGFVLVTMVITTAIGATAVYVLIPNTHVSFGTLVNVAGEEEATKNYVAEQYGHFFLADYYRFVVAFVCAMPLVAVAVHTLTGMSWPKSVAVGIIAPLLRLLVMLIFI